MIKEKTIKINEFDWKWLIKTKQRTGVSIKHLVSVAVDFLQNKHKDYMGKY